jgi:glycosyltransferase involved in cell wall biosynthesis
VFYTWEQSAGKKYDPGFGGDIAWDTPLLEGYEHVFVKNTASRPGSHHYTGIKNPGLIADINAWAPSAILVYGWNFKSHLQCLRYFHGRIPVYFRGDSTLLNQHGAFRRIMRKIFLTWIYWHIDKAFYAGEYNKQYFLEYGLKPDQLAFMPHAVDNNRFHSYIGSEAPLEFDETDIVLLYAGKFEPVKNLEFLIRAFMKVKSRTLKLVLAGSGPLEESLKLIAARDQRIFFLPFQNQSAMPGIYRLCDIFVLPSASETWGLAVNEAMACEKPVVVSSKCGCSIDLVHENGFIFDPQKIEELSAIMERIAESGKTKLAQFGKLSWQRIQKYSLEAQASAVERVIAG